MSMSKGKKILFAIAFGIGGALVVAEVAARLFFHPIRFYNYTYIPTVYHEICSYLPRPGWQGIMDNFDYSIPVAIDEYGLRKTTGGDASASASTVVFFGDSFMFGNGLEDGQTLPSQYAAEAERRGRHVRSVNAGVLGWNPAQEFFYSRIVLDRIKADTVVFGFCIENDVYDNLTYLDSSFRLTDDTLVWTGVPVPEFPTVTVSLPKKILQMSRLYVLMASSSRKFMPTLLALAHRFGWADKAYVAKSSNVLRLFSTSPDEATEQEWKSFESVVRIWNREVRARGARMSIVLFPSSWMLTDELFGKMKNRFPDQEFDRRLPVARMERLCADEGIILVDPSDGLRPELFFMFDGHTRPEGVSIIARKTADAI